MKPTFWKLSQGTHYFSVQEMIDSVNDGLVYLHKDTRAKGRSNKTQAEDFLNASIGDYFYLCHGNEMFYLLGQFTGPVNVFSKKGEGWLDRPFRHIKSSVSYDFYNFDHKRWSPTDNSTFIKVPDNELEMFENLILKPFFDISLNDFGIDY